MWINYGAREPGSAGLSASKVRPRSRHRQTVRAYPGLGFPTLARVFANARAYIYILRLSQFASKGHGP